MAQPDTIERIITMRQEHVAPVASAVGMELIPDAVLRAKPLVLLLGNHSSGKSSFINHLLDKQVQRTGVAPTDDGFTVLLHGELPRQLDGVALTGDPALPFAELARLGPGLVQHLLGRVLNCQLLAHVTLIDSPGMIDSPASGSGGGGEGQRPYDFAEAVRCFAAKADLVLMFFDPEKPGTTGETIRVLTESLAGIDHKLRIVMNKMDLFDGMRDFARTYGALCWNLSRSLRTKDLPHIYTTVLPDLVRPGCTLPLEGFAAALLELEASIAELPQRRTDSVLGRCTDEARLVLMQARVAERLRGGVFASLVKTAIGCLLATILAGIVAWMGALDLWHDWSTDTEGWWRTSWTLLPFLASLPLLWFGPRLIARAAERRATASIDQVFRDEYAEDLSGREHAADLDHDWQRARPSLLRRLGLVGITGIPRVRRTRLASLKRCVEQDMPTLRRTSISL